MGKFLVLSLILFCLVLSVSACLGETQEEESVEKEEEETKAVQPAEIPLTAGRDTEPSININQAGYHTLDIKTAIFRDSSLDTSFDVINIETGESVFTGKVTGAVKTISARETVAYGDFSDVTEPGTYKIKAANSGESYEFVIADEVYDGLFADAIKMFYLQRCGSELEGKYAGDFAHDACHTQKAVVYGTTETLDVSGGWHDAGDYGRYVVPGAKAAADLMLAYEDYSTLFNDNLEIPESENGIPDILDEVRYELEWMLKMQDKSGGVHHKVTSLNFSGMVMPENVKNDLYIMPISNCATGDFSAVMAMAARIYKDHDAAFAKRCLAAAESALSYMERNENNGGYKNPPDVFTGEYGDADDSDEYFWALCELYKTTGNSIYGKKLESVNISSLQNGMGWQAVSLFGCYAYLTSENQSAELSKKIRDKFNAHIFYVKKNIEKDGYFSSVGTVYPWGSNMTLANNGMVLLMANKINEDINSCKLAKKQLDYLLGANAASYCFVTGHGTLTPKNTHHRPSQALGTTMKGMLVGGANSNLDDPYAKDVLAGKPAAKCYVDNIESYSTNEVAIYWNSPFVYLLAGILAGG